MKRLLVGLGLGALCLAAGCKDEIDASKYVESFSSTVCDAVIACSCDYPGGAMLDHCLAQLEVAGSTQVELNSVEGLRFDGECAQKTIDQISSLGCEVLVADPDAACERPCKVWHGPMGKGATCTSVNGFDNCKPGLVCDGVCVDPCDEPDLPKVGEPCAPQYGCEEGAACDAMTTPLFPVCVALPGEGAACLLTDFGPNCAEGLYCDFMDEVCVAPPGVGEPCPDGTCAENLYCDFSDAMPVCAELPGLGEMCDAGICEQPNLCEDGVCVKPRPQVCGFYTGVPEDDGGSDPTIDPTNDPTNDPTLDTGLDTSGGLDTGLDTTGGPDTAGDPGDCCGPLDTPACSNVDIAGCVCFELSTCCTDAWTIDCVDAVTSLGCGQC